jgi:hypothetical protein
MDYGQRPIASSKGMDMMGCSEMPSGINVVVAISTRRLQSEDARISTRPLPNGTVREHLLQHLRETLQKNTITGEEEQF